MFQFCLVPTFAQEEISAEEVKTAETALEQNNEGYWKKVDGKWVFQFVDGEYAEDGWYRIGGKAYYFYGIYMYTGWLEYDGYWYYYFPDGHEASGWQKIGNDWYYFIPGDNEMMSGFNWLEIEGKKYYFDEDGHWLANTWYDAGDYWYYFDKDGNATDDGWVNAGNKWYYLNKGHYACNESIELIEQGKPTWYHFDNNGAMVTNKWVFYNVLAGKWRYFGADGRCAKGWFKQNGIWYYANPGDKYYTARGYLEIDDIYYYFNDDCAMVTGWFQYDDYDEGLSWAYADASGACHSSKWIGDYYLNYYGIMVTYCYVYNPSNGNYYWVDATGKYIPKWTTTEHPKGYVIYNQQTGKVII